MGVLWKFFQPFLFGLIGAAVDLSRINDAKTARTIGKHSLPLHSETYFDMAYTSQLCSDSYHYTPYRSAPYHYTSHHFVLNLTTSIPSPKPYFLSPSSPRSERNFRAWWSFWRDFIPGWSLTLEMGFALSFQAHWKDTRNTTQYSLFCPQVLPVINTVMGLKRSLPLVVGLGIAVLFIGLVARLLISFAVVNGAEFNLKEKIFIAVAWLPKATVQVSSV